MSKIKIKYTTGTKFVGCRFSKEKFWEAYDTYHRVVNNLDSLIHSLIKKERLSFYTPKLSYQKIKLDEKVITDSKFVQWVDSNFPNTWDNLQYVDRIQNIKRSLYHYIGERYVGYYRRNGNKKTRNGSIKHGKSLFIKEAIVDIDAEKKILSIPKLGIEVPYHCAVLDKDKNLEKNKYGGNFKLSQNTFVIKENKEKETTYDPQGFIGFDLNKQSDHWIYMSDGTVVQMPDTVKELIEGIRLQNQIIADRNLKVQDRKHRTKDRRKARKERGKLENKLKKCIRSIAVTILEKAKESKKGLAIDGVGTGQKNGTFGQDHLIVELQSLCVRDGIPYYVVNTPYTTKRCTSCGVAHDNNKVNDNDFLCQNCGYKCITHANAANNMVSKAEWYLSHKFPYGDYRGAKERKTLRDEKRDGWKVEDNEASWCEVVKNK